MKIAEKRSQSDKDRQPERWRTRWWSSISIMAERGGFEPPVDFKGLRRFSKPLLSTTQPPLRF